VAAAKVVQRRGASETAPARRRERAEPSRPATRRPVTKPPREPERAAEGRQYLSELGERGAQLFQTVMPLGPDALTRLLEARALVPQRKTTAPQPPAVLDLLLRLSEVVAADSGYARILRGGAAAFAELGYERTRIEDVLEAGDVSPRTFYQFFRNKAEVLEALVELFLTVLFHVTRADLEAPGEARDKLRRVLRRLVNGVAIIERFARVMIAEALRPGSPVEGTVERLHAELTTQLAPLFRELVPGASDAWIRVRVVATLGVLLELRPSAAAGAEELRRCEDLLTELVIPS
jgi:AcrR family transcriptional regulator